MKSLAGPAMSRLKSWAQAFKTEVAAIALAARDPRTPLAAKLVAGFVVAYALSPIDLIPDFIPVIGYLDDLIIVPLGLALAVRMIPADVLAEHRQAAMANKNHATSYWGAAIVLAIWLTTAVALAHWLF